MHFHYNDLLIQISRHLWAEIGYIPVLKISCSTFDVGVNHVFGSIGSQTEHHYSNNLHVYDYHKTKNLLIKRLWSPIVINGGKVENTPITVVWKIRFECLVV